MTPYRNQRLEPQKSLVRLVQMMIFLFKKKKWNFWGSFRNHRRSFFCPMFTHRSLLNWFSGMWNTRHSRGGKPLQGPWGVTPTTLFLRGWKERNRPHLWYHSKIFRSQKFRKVGWWEPFPQILLAWYVVLKKKHHFYIHLKTGCLRYQEGLRINMTGDSCFFRKITMGKWFNMIWILPIVTQSWNSKQPFFKGCFVKQPFPK